MFQKIKQKAALVKTAVALAPAAGIAAGQAAPAEAERPDTTPFRAPYLRLQVNNTVPEHEFMGRHLVVSYFGCDDASLRDIKSLNDAMKVAIKASGATLLKSTSHIFPPDGMTSVYLLSESHASIHTYPEFSSCFVDLFTCGTTCSAEKFDTALRNYLKPREVNSRVLLRHKGIEEDRLREV